MAISIRLRRVGKKKSPFYRIVVQDRRAAPAGAVIEEVGTHDPLREPVRTVMKKDRIQFWMAQGAQVSAKVRTLIEAAGGAGA